MSSIFMEVYVSSAGFFFALVAILHKYPYGYVRALLYPYGYGTYYTRRDTQEGYLLDTMGKGPCQWVEKNSVKCRGLGVLKISYYDDWGERTR